MTTIDELKGGGGGGRGSKGKRAGRRGERPGENLVCQLESDRLFI